MKKISKFLLLISGICLLCACSNNKNTENKINVDSNGFLTKESIKNIQEKNNYVSLDVRTKDEYDEKHIIDSILIPYDEISAKTVNIDKDKTILVYCRSGKRALTAVEKLKSLGYTAYNMGAIDNIDLPKK